MKVATAILALVLLPVAYAAEAQQLSGSYALTFQRTCEVLVSGGQIIHPGHVAATMGTANFDPVSGMAQVNIITVSGNLVSPLSSDMAQTPLAVTVPFATTPTTLTIAGMTLNAVYHRIVAGVANRVLFNGLVDDVGAPNDCAVVGELELDK